MDSNEIKKGSRRGGFSGEDSTVANLNEAWGTVYAFMLVLAGSVCHGDRRQATF
jgi:hypothetical protein